MSFWLLGNSFTRGYCCDGKKEHPYALELQKQLARSHSGLVAVVMAENGELGSDVLRRLRTVANSLRCDAACVFVGVNDIDAGHTQSEVFAVIGLIARELERRGCRQLLLCALPACPVDSAWTTERKRGHNRALRDTYGDARRPGGVVTVVVNSDVDLQGSVRPELFDEDGLHLTPTGYDALGKLVFEAWHSAAAVSSTTLAA